MRSPVNGLLYAKPDGSPLRVPSTHNGTGSDKATPRRETKSAIGDRMSFLQLRRNRRRRTRDVFCLEIQDPATSVPQLNGISTRRLRSVADSSTAAVRETPTVSTVILNARTSASFRGKSRETVFDLLHRSYHPEGRTIPRFPERMIATIAATAADTAMLTRWFKRNLTSLEGRRIVPLSPEVRLAPARFGSVVKSTIFSWRF